MRHRNRLPVLIALWCLPAVLWPASSPAAQPTRPARAILFLIDAVHWQAMERLDLPTLEGLAKQGVYFKRAHCIAPDHPTTGPYGRLHTTSLPNPTLQSGTLFIRPDSKMIQECFWPEQLTAHAVNITAYRSLNRGFHYSMMLHNADDEAVIDYATDLMRKADIRFARFHLQGPGTGGTASVKTTQDVPWRKNIWGEGSPYIAALTNADRLLGEFITALKQMDRWDDTLLVVMPDHGQASQGWHPPMQEEGWVLPLIFVGPGVAKGRTFDYAETIDVAPTICHLMGLDPPTTGPGSGVVLREVRTDFDGDPPKRPQRVRKINEQIRDYRLLRGKLLTRSLDDAAAERAVIVAGRSFFGTARILQWHEAGSVDALIKTNDEVLAKLQAAVRR